MLELTAALIIFLFPLAYSPGPGNLFFAATGATCGVRSTIPLSSGYHLATWIITLAIGFGFLEVAKRYPALFPLITVLGALYVFWLAWKIIRSTGMPDTRKSDGAGFQDGVILLVLNPKAYFIIAAMFAQFIEAGQSNQLILILWITTVFTLNNLLAFTLWTIAGDRLGRLFRNDSSARQINIFQANQKT